VQVDPITLTVEAPGTERLKLKCDKLLSTSAFKFNLRRYNSDGSYTVRFTPEKAGFYQMVVKIGGEQVKSSKLYVIPAEAGAYTRPLRSST
jgi:hypothetical protein